MHKLLYFASIGLLAFSIGGCGDGGGNTASPSPSPSGASPSPAASASPTPGTQTFSSPVVAAQPPGLIRSTNPDERARQAQTGIGDNKKTLKITAAPSLSVPLDPFGGLPLITVQNPLPTDGAGANEPTDPFPKLAQREVKLLTPIPESSPPQILGDSGSKPSLFPGLSATQPGLNRRGGLSVLGGSGAQIGSPPLVPGLTATQLGRGSGNASTPGGGPAQIGSPPLVPGLTATQLGRPTAASGAPQPIAAKPLGLPNLPPLPVDKRPPQWRNLNPFPRRGTRTNPRPPQPIAARPLGLPNLPPLPVDKRPPQWRDPNPPPAPEVPVVPPPPSTDLATGTEVSGVVKVGNETQVIVRVPTEPTSRYVKVGQRLSNGQVLVKRVEIKPGSDPIVILEENGVEVAKAVGEKSPSREKNPANAVISRLPNPNSSGRR